MRGRWLWRRPSNTEKLGDWFVGDDSIDQVPEPSPVAPAQPPSELFEDSGLSIALDRGELVFTTEIDDALKRLDAQLRPLGAVARAPSEILADDRMVAVREQARHVLFELVRLEAQESQA